MQCPTSAGIFWNYHLKGRQARRFTLGVNEEIAQVLKGSPTQLPGSGHATHEAHPFGTRAGGWCGRSFGLRVIAIAPNANGENLDGPLLGPAPVRGRHEAVHRAPSGLLGRARRVALYASPLWQLFWRPACVQLGGHVGGRQRVAGPPPPDLHTMFPQGGG